MKRLVTPDGMTLRRGRGLRSVTRGLGVPDQSAPTFLYTTGTEDVAWVEGFSQNSGSVSKQADHLFAQTTSGGLAMEDSRRAWVTDAAVDLTGVDAIVVDWEHVINGNGVERASFVASTVKENNEVTFDARLLFQSGFARREDTLDVSGLTGVHFIRVHSTVQDTSAVTSSSSTVRVFNVKTLA